MFLLQNVFQKETHSRTIFINTHYMTLFRNARDQTQIRFLARQIFPTDYNGFLTYYEKETNKEHGQVILDLQPLTRNDDRIVKFYLNEPAVSNDENATDQQFIAESQKKDDEQSEQLQHNAIELEQHEQHIEKVKDMHENKQEQELSAVRYLLTKQQQGMELIQKSLSDIKRSVVSNKNEVDDSARGFQNKQQQDMEVIQKSLIDLKQSMKRSRSESDVLDKDSLSSKGVHGTKNHMHNRNKDSKDSRKRKKKVRDNVPDDWNAPL